MEINKNEIKIKVWGKVSQYIDSEDNDFNNSACSFRITDNYNLVVWCDIDYENYDTLKDKRKYFIVSIRYNPYDELFGDDIGIEECTEGIDKKELEEVIDKLLVKLEVVE